MKASRREVVGWLGAATLVVPTLGSAPAAAAAPSRDADPIPRVLSAADLLAPLQPGASLGSCTLLRFGTLHAGAVSVEISTPDAAPFFIDICARDDGPGAPAPPARTSRCDLFLANEGSGTDPTHETQGLAAMALAEIIQTNEHRADLRGLLTLRQRLDRHRSEVVRSCVEAPAQRINEDGGTR